MSGHGVLRNVAGDKKAFWCPGCKEMHPIPVGGNGWQWNGSYDKPTFMPSVFVRGVVITAKGEFQYRQWCDAGYRPGALPENLDSKSTCCHSYVRDGRIQFLADCTHELRNQTVELVPMPD